MHNINVFDDLWPIRGEWLRYIWPDTIPDYFIEPKLTHNNEYQVEAIRFIPCKDQIKIIDDEGLYFWVDLYKFSFVDQRNFYNEE